jgi:hypothetical protein
MDPDRDPSAPADISVMFDLAAYYGQEMRYPAAACMVGFGAATAVVLVFNS